jgi:hypothetical protein
VSLISQSGSDYQVAEVTVDAGTARDIMLMLLDVHAVLDHLYLDGTRPGVTAPAEDYLRESTSLYSLSALIGALGDVITMLSSGIRDAMPSAGLAAQRGLVPAGGARSEESSGPGQIGPAEPGPGLE